MANLSSGGTTVPSQTKSYAHPKSYYRVLNDDGTKSDIFAPVATVEMSFTNEDGTYDQNWNFEIVRVNQTNITDSGTLGTNSTVTKTYTVDDVIDSVSLGGEFKDSLKTGYVDVQFGALSHVHDI